MTSKNNRLKRLHIRSWRRGTKEMDLILGSWADAHLTKLDDSQLDLYERLLHENDQDMMSWMLQNAPCPADFKVIISKIMAFTLKT